DGQRADPRRGLLRRARPARGRVGRGDLRGRGPCHGGGALGHRRRAADLPNALAYSDLPVAIDRPAAPVDLRLGERRAAGAAPPCPTRADAPLVAGDLGAIVFAVWSCFEAARLQLPVSAALCVLAFLGVGISLPSSPGFIGVFQAATVLALSLFGVSGVDALSFSLLLHACQFVPVTVWGLLLLLAEHVSLTDAGKVGAAPSTTPSGPAS